MTQDWSSWNTSIPPDNLYNWTTERRVHVNRQGELQFASQSNGVVLRWEPLYESNACLRRSASTVSEAQHDHIGWFVPIVLAVGLGVWILRFVYRQLAEGALRIITADMNGKV